MWHAGLRITKAHITHPELKATFCLDIIGIKKNPNGQVGTTWGLGQRRARSGFVLWAGHLPHGEISMQADSLHQLAGLVLYGVAGPMNDNCRV